MIQGQRRRKKKGRWYQRSIRFKMVLYSVVCVVGITLCGNLYLFSYLNNIIVEKANNIDTIYLDNLTDQITNSFEVLYEMGLNCANHQDVIRAMSTKQVKSVEDKKSLIQAQNVMNDFLATTKMSAYVNKMMIFNTQGTLVQAVGNHLSSLGDTALVIEKKKHMMATIENRKSSFVMEPSITPNAGNSFTILFKVNGYSYVPGTAYFYMEVDTSLITDILADFDHLNHAVVWDGKDRNTWISNNNRVALQQLIEQVDGDSIQIEKERYKLDTRKIQGTNVSLYHFTNITALSIQDSEILYTLRLVVILSIIIACGSLILVSKWITRPISKLIARIEKITKNDFSYDPEIERPHDEIGEIGRVVNEMVQSVSHLLDEVVRTSEEKNNIEMAMLQAQVNPHFLYNTLDSIHWMAVIQKAPGISSMTRSLSNLLKNMAKGVSDKILLAEELSLLKDYMTIQGIRYAESFEYRQEIPESLLNYRIVKMTLQPIVENAIFHGIEPSGRLGVITVGGYEEDDYLYLTVTDTGIGMSKEQIRELLREKKESDKNTMSGIGVSNVNKRLKLLYGKECGLSVESKLEEYTTMIIKVRKEKDDV